MSNTKKIVISIFIVFIGLFIANAFAPYELRSFYLDKNGENPTIIVNGAERILEIDYSTGYHRFDKNLLIGFGGYEEFAPANHGSIAVVYEIEANELDVINITQMQANIDGQTYQLPIPKEPIQFEKSTDYNVDHRPYVYIPLSLPAIPQHTLDLDFTANVTDKYGKISNIKYRATAKIVKEVKTVAHWHNFFRLFMA